MATHPFADAQRSRNRRARRTAAAASSLDLDERDVGIGIRADARRVQVPSVGQPHHDAVGAVDDVMIREDQAVGVDDEAGAGAAAWALRIALAGTIEQLGTVGHRQAAEARRRSDDRPREVASMLTTAGFEPLGDVRKRDERAATGPCAAARVRAGTTRRAGRRDRRLRRHRSRRRSAR